MARIETLQSNVTLLEAQILETQKAKAKVDKELEAEKFLKEQKIKVKAMLWVHKKIKHRLFSEWIEGKTS